MCLRQVRIGAPPQGEGRAGEDRGKVMMKSPDRRESTRLGRSRLQDQKFCQDKISRQGPEPRNGLWAKRQEELISLGSSCKRCAAAHLRVGRGRPLLRDLRRTWNMQTTRVYVLHFVDCLPDEISYLPYFYLHVFYLH